MERFWPTLRASYAYGFVGLLAGSYVGSVIYALGRAIEDGITFKSVLFAPLTGLFVALFAFGFGVLPALFVGIPAYAALRYKGVASYWTAALVGLVPGGLMSAVWEPPMVGAVFAGYGALVGLLTHYVARVASEMAIRELVKPKSLVGTP